MEDTIVEETKTVTREIVRTPIDVGKVTVEETKTTVTDVVKEPEAGTTVVVTVGEPLRRPIPPEVVVVET